MELCKELEIVRYYEELSNDNQVQNLAEKKQACNNSTGTYSTRYTELTDLSYCPAIYESFMREDLRILLTRWRMSCVELAIERGRYEGLNREERLCAFCNVLEDEEHAIFNCRAYDTIRSNFGDLLQQYPTLKQILNPVDKEAAEIIGLYLKQIEAERKSLLRT